MGVLKLKHFVSLPFVFQRLSSKYAHKFLLSYCFRLE